MDCYHKMFKKRQFEGVVVGQVDRKNFDRYELTVCMDFFTHDHVDELCKLREKLQNAIHDYTKHVTGDVEEKNFGRWELALRVHTVTHGSDADLRRLYINVTTAAEKVLGAKEYPDVH